MTDGRSDLVRPSRGGDRRHRCSGLRATLGGRNRVPNPPGTSRFAFFPGVLLEREETE